MGEKSLVFPANGATDGHWPPLPRGRQVYAPLLVVLAAVSAGIVADRYLAISWPIWALGTLAALSVWAVWWSQRRDRLAGLAILMAAAAVGGLWHHLYWRYFHPWEIARYSAWDSAPEPAEPLTPKHPPASPAETVLEGPLETHPVLGGDMSSASFRFEPVVLEAVVKTTPYQVPVSGLPPWQEKSGLKLFRFLVEVCGVRDKSQWRPAAGRVWVRVNARQLDDLTGRFGLGDRVRIFGQLGRIAPPANPGEYDFAQSARTYRVLCMLNCSDPECIELRTPAAWYRPDRLLEAVRRENAQRFSQYRTSRSGGQTSKETDSPFSANLAATILLGLREELPPDYTEPFVRTGTVHLLAISGLHVGMVLVMVWWGMRLVGASRSVEILAMAAAALGYLFLSGARPPTVRATILVELACLAALLGRSPLGWNTLAAAGLVILALNPAELFRLGTQLSFLAVGCLLAIVPEGPTPRILPPKRPRDTLLSASVLLRRFPKLLAKNRPATQGWASFWQRLRRWKDYVGTWFGPLDPADPLDRLILRTMSRPQRWIRSVVRRVGWLFFSGAVIWAAAVPLIMAKMHLCPLSGLVLNVLVWIPMLLAIASGLLFLMLGWIGGPAAWLLGGVCLASLEGLEKLVHWAVHWPGSYFWTPGPSGWWLMGFYGGLAAWGVYFRHRLRRRWAWGLLTLWMVLGFSAGPVVRSFCPHPPGRWECTFLSVGHGLAVVLHLPDGQTWLYDVGAMGDPDRTAHLIACYLWTRGITSLDALFLSHLDQDHINALPNLQERIPIRRLLLPSPMLARLAPIFPKIQNPKNKGKQAASEDKSPSTQTERPSSSDLSGTSTPLGPPPEEELAQAIWGEAKEDLFVETLHASCQWQAGPSIQVWVFHPPPEGVVGGDNAQSLVLGLEVYGRRVLLTGDLESPGIERLLNQPPWDCDLLLAPHHGSRKSRPAELAQWCRPKCVVISGGRMLPTRITEAEYRAVGTQVWHTGLDGAVRVMLEPHQVQTHSQWRPTPIIVPLTRF